MSQKPSLLEVQRAVHRAIALGDSAGLEGAIATDAMAIAGAVSIHRNTIRWGLTRALRLSYPAVERLVGEEFFEAAVAQFLRQFWPRSACLDDFGSDFCAFLGSFAPVSNLCYLADVARLEWAVHEALHAPQASALRLEPLLELAPSHCADVCFVADPSLRFVATNSPADLIWRAVLEQDDCALDRLQVKTPEPRWLLVQRSCGASPDVLATSESEWRFVKALSSGRALGDALEEFCRTAPQHDAGPLLARHLSAGRFARYSLAPSCLCPGGQCAIS